MTRFGKLTKATTLAVAIAAGFGASTSAQAGALATSLLDVSNFTINFTGGGQVPFNFFASAFVTDQGTNSAKLNGISDLNPAASGTVVNGPSTFDLSRACVGVVCPGPNIFTKSILTSVSPNQYAWADSLVTGSPVSGYSGNPSNSPARATTQAEVKLSGAGVGNGGSDLSLQTTMGFFVSGLTLFTLDFNADSYQRSALTPNANVPGSSAATGGHLSFVIADSTGTEVFRWSPNGTVDAVFGGVEHADGFNLTRTTGASLPGQDNGFDSGVQHFNADINGLAAGFYTFTIDHGVSARAQFVPEPGSLALAGIALLALVGSRRNKKAA